MTHVYLLAHFDDELGVLPLMMERAKSNAPQAFIYVASYSDELFAIRKAETANLLSAFGFNAASIFTLHTRALDGSLHKQAVELYSELSQLLDGMGPIDSLTTTAWEGGHNDHDVCAALAVCLGKTRGVQVDQFSLYNGKDLPWRLFRGAWPLKEGGPERTVKLGLQDWLKVLAAVRFYPSQWRTWMGLWPAMAVSYLLRGFVYQDLDPTRVTQRPHPGALLYERMFKVEYSEVRSSVDAVLDAAQQTIALSASD